VREKTKDQGNLDMLNNLNGHSGNFEAQKWTKTVDRGGLIYIYIYISNKAFRFFLAIEYATQKDLRISNVVKMDEKLHIKLKNLIIGYSDVDFT